MVTNVKTFTNLGEPGYTRVAEVEGKFIGITEDDFNNACNLLKTKDIKKVIWESEGHFKVEFDQEN